MGWAVLGGLLAHKLSKAKEGSVTWLQAVYDEGR